MSGKFTVNAGWNHVPHLSEEQKREELARIQPFQRKARSEGIPSLGAYEVWTRMSTGRLKAFHTLANWLSELRFYQRNEKGRIKDGQADHLMDCTRYLVLSGLARATVRPSNFWRSSYEANNYTASYDPFGHMYR